MISEIPCITPVVFFSGNENCKQRYGLGDCSDICLPTADGHICTCDSGRKNLQDRHMCVNGSVTLLMNFIHRVRQMC